MDVVCTGGRSGAADVLGERLFDSRRRLRVLYRRSRSGNDCERETRRQDC